MTTLSIADWTTYLSVLAEVAATLTGLVFVAVSINLSRILSVLGLTGRAAESLMQLFGVVIISTSALIPRQVPIALGTEIVVVSSGLWLLQTILQVRYSKTNKGHPRYWLVTRIIQTQLSNIPFLIAGILILIGSPEAMYWLAPGCILSLIAGIMGAWVL